MLELAGCAIAMIAYCVLDKNGNMLCAFSNKYQAEQFAKSLVKCRGAVVKEMKIVSIDN